MGVRSGTEEAYECRFYRQKLQEESATKKHRLGTWRKVGTRVYHYACVTEAVTVGQVVSWHEDPVALADNGDIATEAIGENEILIKPNPAVTLNEYEDGYFTVEAGTGLGQILTIRNHPVIALNTAGYIFLYDGLIVATAVGDSHGQLLRNEFDVQLANHTNPQVEIPVGVAPMTFTTGVYYGWVQSWGPAVVTAGVATMVAGVVCNIAEDVSGTAQIPVAIGAVTGYEPQLAPIGYALTAAADTVPAPVYLTMAP